jgi:hypothetical protein
MVVRQVLLAILFFLISRWKFYFLLALHIAVFNLANVYISNIFLSIIYENVFFTRVSFFPWK